MMFTHLEDEAELVQESQRGSCESFGVLVKHYEEQIYRLAFVVTRNAADAEEVLKETFLKAHSIMPRFDKQTRLSLLLVRIALDEALARLRRHQSPLAIPFAVGEDTHEPVSMPTEIEGWGKNPKGDYVGTEFNTILSKTLLSLTTGLRLTFLLRDMGGLSAEDTANLLGISVPTVRNLLHRARLKLREGLSSWFENRSVLAR